MRAGRAITQEETIRDRADNHRDRKCRETDDTRDRGCGYYRTLYEVNCNTVH